MAVGLPPTTGAPITTVTRQYTNTAHKVIVLNVEGLLPYKFKEKIKLLSELIKEEKALILALTETHLSENIREAEIAIENYTSFRTDRADQRKKGGVITYIQNHQAALTEVLYSESNSYTETQMLFIKDIDVIFINMYRPPACPSNKFLEPLAKIRGILQSLPTPMPNIMLTGDLNFPLIKWDSESVYGGAEDMRVQATALLQLAGEFCLNQHINCPTRGNNILDIVMTNNDELLHDYVVEKTNLSDHNVITLTTNLIMDKQHYATSQAQQAKINFNQLNFFSASLSWADMKKELSEVDWLRLMKGQDAETQYKLLLEKCLEISTKHVPKRRQLYRNNIPRDRKLLMRKRTKLRKKMRHTTKESTKHQIEENITTIEAKLKKSVETENARKEVHAVSCIKTNSKYFYKYAATKSQVRAGVGPLRDTNGRITREPTEIADVLRQQYEEVFSIPCTQKLVHSPHDFFHQDIDLTPKLTDIEFTTHNIQEAIKEMGTNAAAGPDQFPAILLKNCPEELSTPLHIFYRNSLDSGMIPTQLKSAKITPIYKGGSRAEAKNYRPIALTSHIIKVLEKLLVKRMSSYLEENDKLNQDQYGFRAGRSCLAQLLAHYEKIIAALEHNKNIDVIYLDFAKAYDKVDHGILIHKVREMGIMGKIGVWLHSFLTNREQSVAVSGVVTQPSVVTSGVPQGSVLGPLLFLIHISDITDHTEHSTVASFADDTRVLREVSSESEAALLQADLSALYSWADENNMSFNNNKFEHMMYSPSIHNNDAHVYLAQDESHIVTKENIRDLGVTLSCDGNFTTHITNVTKKARSQVGWILRVFKTRDTLPMMTIYKSLVLPLLEYCCQLWSPWRVGEKQLIESVQRTFTSKIHEVQHLDYWGRLQSLRLFSLERRRERYAILYTYKILNGYVINNINIHTNTHQRLGRLCHVERIHPRATTRIKTLKEHAFATRGPRLFNALPRHIRDATNLSLEQFKTQLDKFLWTIPDQPKLPHYHLRATGNSIIDQLAQQRADGTF